MARKIEGGSAIPVAIVSGGASTEADPNIALILAQVQAIAADVDALNDKTPGSVEASSDNVDQPAANTAAEITLFNIAGIPQVIGGVAWGYDADPTGGSLTITDGTDTLFYVPITKGGPGYFNFIPPMKSGADGFVITLAAGGEGVTGSLSVMSHWEEA